MKLRQNTFKFPKKGVCREKAQDYIKESLDFFFVLDNLRDCALNYYDDINSSNNIKAKSYQIGKQLPYWLL